jgi:hypothetical protein
VRQGKQAPLFKVYPDKQSEHVRSFVREAQDAQFEEQLLFLQDPLLANNA